MHTYYLSESQHPYLSASVANFFPNLCNRIYYRCVPTDWQHTRQATGEREQQLRAKSEWWCTYLIFLSPSFFCRFLKRGDSLLTSDFFHLFYRLLSEMQHYHGTEYKSTTTTTSSYPLEPDICIPYPRRVWQVRGNFASSSTEIFYWDL